MTYLRGYVVLLALATMVLTAAGVARLIDAPPTPGTAPPSLGVSLAGVDEVPQRVRVLGYERSHFGHGWAATTYQGCDTRQVMLLSATGGVACEATGLMVDPYTGDDLLIGDGGDPVEVDHVFPLSAAWDLGAHSWGISRRLDFANDPRNLVVTSRTANQQKSDDLPASWLPTHPGSRCWYARRLAEVAQEYSLALPSADVSAMKRQCRLRQIWPG